MSGDKAKQPQDKGSTTVKDKSIDAKGDVLQTPYEKAVGYADVVPLHKQKSMEFEVPPGFVGRMVSEKPGRIEAFRRAGWMPLEDPNADLGQKNVQDPSQLGSMVRRVVNPSTPSLATTGVFMIIPEELYNKAQEDKLRENAELLSSIDPERREVPGSKYGHLSIEDKEQYK